MLEELFVLTGKPAEELSIAFIPTAANVEEGDKGWLIDDLIILAQAVPSDSAYQTRGKIDVYEVRGLMPNHWLTSGEGFSRQLQIVVLIMWIHLNQFPIYAYYLSHKSYINYYKKKKEKI